MTPSERARTALLSMNAKGLHLSGCNTRKRYSPPTNERTGETYDVYIVPHCDCWLSDPFPTDLTVMLKIVRAYEIQMDVHDHECAVYFPIRELYRGREVSVRRNCDCWLAKPVETC